MKLATPSYQDQLETLCYLIDRPITSLYFIAFTIASENKWLEFDGESYDEDDIVLLRAIDEESISVILKMIDELEQARTSIKIMNNLIGDETEEDDGYEEGDEEEGDPALADNEEEAKNGVLNIFEEEDDEDDEMILGQESDEEAFFTTMLFLYFAIWRLSGRQLYERDMYDVFSERFTCGGLIIESEDKNVQILLTALNRVLELNAKTRFFARSNLRY